jgi:hypothetical protein
MSTAEAIHIVEARLESITGQLGTPTTSAGIAQLNYAVTLLNQIREELKALDHVTYLNRADVRAIVLGYVGAAAAALLHDIDKLPIITKDDLAAPATPKVIGIVTEEFEKAMEVARAGNAKPAEYAHPDSVQTLRDNLAPPAKTDDPAAYAYMAPRPAIGCICDTIEAREQCMNVCANSRRRPFTIRPPAPLTATEEALMAIGHLSWIEATPGIHPHRVNAIKAALERLAREGQ